MHFLSQEKKEVDVNICYYALCHFPELTSKANNIVMTNYLGYLLLMILKNKPRCKTKRKKNYNNLIRNFFPKGSL